MTSSCQWNGCGRSFETSTILGEHIVSSHLDGESFFCQWGGCQKRNDAFPSKSSLMAHLRSHSGEKPHWCSICDKRFSRSDALNKHIKSIHIPAEGSSISVNPFGQPHLLKQYLSLIEDDNVLLAGKLRFMKKEIQRLRAEKYLILDLITSTNTFAN